ncbi:hypothetical protein CH296_26855 [Rhodococcus sp. 14-2496-1d]|uniref:hypothetical protein n=1 Tax=Rhodococcus sp. 14-2496-1d TaxID=2023146 RepID=UPI000B9C5619|nr:hypothetical protein [Rhodococcus sp. 14-2496-1d]OZF25734.1 hypothetical protein CH296_26855 [Rhodococcus sp. 14-2496-1d]
MDAEQARYEVTEIKVIRGAESKTIAGKQQEGWELVDRQDGILRTTITFRRPKPKPPWRLWAALGGVGVILAGIITVGALTEDDDASTTDAAAPSRAEQPSPQPTPEQEAEPSSSADPMICDTTDPWSRGGPCRFGQTAIYSDTRRDLSEVRLEITVGAPVEFVLSEDAIIESDQPPYPVSVYFPVTVKNISPDSTMPSKVSTQATNAEQSKYSGTYVGIQKVSDGDVGSRSVTP